MWFCVAFSLALLSELQTGECQLSVSTDPPPGVVGYFPETQNVVLICRVSNNDGSRRVTTWLKQTSEDSQTRQPITNDGDPNFLLSSEETIITPVGNFNDSSILTIVSLTGLDTAIIFCGADNPLANFILRIYYPPVLVDRGEVRKRENEELSMDMADPDSPLAFPFPSQVSWTKDGEEVENVSSTRVFNYSSIFIGSVQPSDSGVYLLSATNYQLDGSPLGTDTAFLTLDIIFRASFEGQGSETVAVVEGETVTLVCGTGLMGNPLPTISWTDNSGRVVADGGRISLSTDREEVSLTLESTTVNDTGYWNCTAQVYDGDNVVGQSVERSIRLVVVVPPVAPVDLSAKQFGPTWIYLQWFQPSTGRGNPPLSSHVVIVQEVGGQTVNRTFQSDEIEANVTDLLPGTEYIFSVVAVSQFEDLLQATSPPSNLANGTTTLTVPLVVCQKPVVRDTELVISWTYSHTGGLNITSTMVLYSYNNSTFAPLHSAGGSGSHQSGGESGSGRDYSTSPAATSVSIPLPVAGVTYYFRVEASNDKGSGSIDCSGYFLTTGIPFVPEQPEVNSCSSNGVNLTLFTSFSGVNNTTQDDFQFILHVSDTANDSVVVDTVIPVMCLDGGGQCSVTHLVSNLSLASNSYNISVGARNRFGSSDKSTILTIPGSHMCTESDDSGIPLIIILIGASVGGVMLVTVTLCVIAVVHVVRGRNKSSQVSKDNVKSPTYIPTTTDRVDLRPPIVNDTLQSLGQPSFETSVNCETVGNKQETTFTSQREEEMLYDQRPVTQGGGPDNQLQEEVVEEAPVPDNDAAMYRNMALKTAEDDDYEELTSPAYDVPRRAMPACVETPIYYNASSRAVMYSLTSTSRLV